MRANTLLVRWAGGWTDRSSGGGERIEALLGLGALGALDEAQRVADAQLAVFAAPREEITAAVDQAADATVVPYQFYRCGDTIYVPGVDGSDLEKVTSITVSEDENGRMVATPTLKDYLLDEAERLFQSAKKMTNGTL